MRFHGEEDDEMHRARAKHAADEARWHREDQAVGEKMWRDKERARQHAARGGRPRGAWNFVELLNTEGVLTGWRVELNEKLEGILILRDGDLIALASGDAERGDPGPEEILAEFLQVHPHHVQVRR